MINQRRRKMPRKQSKESKTKRVRFSLQAPEAQSVSLAGDFNGWDANALPMKKDTKGTWKASVDLEPGRYEYRLCVDGCWQDDPGAQELVYNPFGSQNSVRFVS
jgi:1,4-alpha-glucan branching enzyme